MRYEKYGAGETRTPHSRAERPHIYAHGFNDAGVIVVIKSDGDAGRQERRV
jgi:hypothetical protein